jgi:hypothetical protein
MLTSAMALCVRPGPHRMHPCAALITNVGTMCLFYMCMCFDTISMCLFLMCMYFELITVSTRAPWTRFRIRC